MFVICPSSITSNSNCVNKDGNCPSRNSWFCGWISSANDWLRIYRCQLGRLWITIFGWRQAMESASWTAGIVTMPLLCPLRSLHSFQQLIPAFLLLVGVQFLPYSPVCKYANYNTFFLNFFLALAAGTRT